MRPSFQKKLTLWQRFRREAIYFGIPMVGIELVGLPLLGWGIALAMIVPATLVGLLAYTAIEHSLLSALEGGNKPQDR
ncbi:MAG: hypothetical protein WBE13_16705 [Candidatus Acidiferrum sp.]